MKFISLASGSKGNCAIIKTNRTTLLLDCGIGMERLERAFFRLKINPSEIDGILVTHEHSDHVASLAAFSEKYNCTIYTHSQARLPVICRAKINNESNIKSFDKPFSVKDMYIEFAPLCHDSAHCVGYRVSDEHRSIAALTDLGIIDDHAMSLIKDSSMVLLESNHDEVMLHHGEYPQHLKKRIASIYGHLSNRQAAEVLVKLPDLNIRKVLLGHISQNNNSSEMVFSNALFALKAAGIVEGKDLSVDVITQNTISEVYEVGK